MRALGGSSAGRRSWASRVALTAAFLLAASGLAGCGDAPDEPTLGQRLQRYPEGEKARVVRLAGGVRVAVGSPDRHRIQVQWGREYDDTWSAPETVLVDRLFTHDVNLVHRGAMLAIDVDWWTQERLDDDYGPRRTSQVLCRPFTCLPGHGSDALSGTELSADGEVAAFGLGRQRVLLWDRDQGFRSERFRGVDEHDVVHLNRDGAFLAASARRDGDRCRYTLLASRERDTSFSPAATSPVAAGLAPCDIGSFRALGDAAAIDVEGEPDPVSFRRTDDGWVASVLRSPLVAAPDTNGRSTLAPARLDVQDQGSAVVSSTDMRTIVEQHRPPSGGDWSRPAVVARAPEGTLCRQQEPGFAQHGALVLVRCWPEDRTWHVERPGDAAAGLLLTTLDGSTWRVRRLAGAAQGPGDAGDGRQMVITPSQLVLWEAGAFEVVDLPSDPDHDWVSLTPDGRRVMRLSGNADPAALCRPRLFVTSVGARSWGAPTPVPVDLPDPTVCSGFLTDVGRSYELEVHTASGSEYGWYGTARLVGDGWQVSAR